MAYSKPYATIRQLSPALIVGTVTQTVLAAPGVGKCIRVVGGVFSLTRSATGIVDFVLHDGTGIQLWGVSGQSVGGGAFAPLILPEPGIQLGDNVSLQVDSVSTVAAGNSLTVIAYFIDQL